MEATPGVEPDRRNMTLSITFSVPQAQEHHFHTREATNRTSGCPTTIFYLDNAEVKGESLFLQVRVYVLIYLLFLDVVCYPTKSNEVRSAAQEPNQDEHLT
jgi:hypothetical protein